MFSFIIFYAIYYFTLYFSFHNILVINNFLHHISNYFFINFRYIFNLLCFLSLYFQPPISSLVAILVIQVLFHHIFYSKPFLVINALFYRIPGYFLMNFRCIFNPLCFLSSYSFTTSVVICSWIFITFLLLDIFFHLIFNHPVFPSPHFYFNSFSPHFWFSTSSMIIFSSNVCFATFLVYQVFFYYISYFTYVP